RLAELERENRELRRANEILKRSDGGGDRVADRFRTVASKRWAGLDSNATVLWHTRQVQQHGEAGGSFNESADGGTLETKDEVALPMTRDSPILGIGWPLTDEHLVADEALSASTNARPRDAERTTGVGSSVRKCRGPLLEFSIQVFSAGGR